MRVPALYSRAMATVTVGESVSPAEAPPAAIERPDFEIVPRRGRSLVGAVLVLLIATIAANKLWPLAFFHFVGGASWTIIDLFLGFVLGPIMGKLSVPARVEFTTRGSNCGASYGCGDSMPTPSGTPATRRRWTLLAARSAAA